MTDRFGLKAERAILGSGVRNIFTPHQPIDDVDLLFGRSVEVRSIIQQINTPGQHALLYGERGVGKSSLANVAAELILGHLAGSLFVSRCDSSSTFESILRAPLVTVGVDLELVEQTLVQQEESSQRANLKVYEQGGVQTSQSLRTYRPSAPISPSRAAELLSPLESLLVVDELDSIEVEQKRKLAELIKLLSDSGSPFKVMVVGIAETADQLTGGHPSVARCLKETRVPRMTDGGLREVIVGGADALSLQFTDPAVSSIVNLSSGYPHFTHLLALKASEAAIIEERSSIDKNDVRNAMDAARADAEGTLKRAYDSAVRSYGTEMYQTILIAASGLTRVEEVEFTAGELRAAIGGLTGEQITQNSLNNHFKRLVSMEGDRVLLRVAKGVYRFSDPRMPSYVRIANGVLD